MKQTSLVGWLKIAVLVFGLYVLSQVTAIYLPVMLAVVTAFILNPLVNFLTSIPLGTRKFYLPRSIAIIISLVLTVMLLAVLITFVLLPFISEFNHLVSTLPKLANKINELTRFIEKTIVLAQVPDNIQTLIEDSLGRTMSYVIGLVKNAINVAFAFATQAFELVVVPVLAYYFLKDWQILKRDVITLFPRTYRITATALIEEMGTVISNYIRGQVQISVIMGLLVFCGMYWLQVDYPLVLGLLAALTEAIPIIGPIIGALPAIVLGYFVSPVLAIKVAAFYILIQQVENHIIVPKMMGHTIELHPVVIIISLLIGGHLYGIAGMILAVPVAALLKVLLRHLWAKGDDNKDR